MPLPPSRKKIYFKVVNPSDKSVDVELQVKKDFKPKKVAMQLIAPDSLQARNTLDNRDTVRPVAGKVEQNGQTIKFTLPRFSAGVVIIGGDKR
jgi:alpha-L-arabinofuranosidase